MTISTASFAERDVELNVQEALVDVVPVAAANRRPAVVPRIPHHAEPRLEVVAVVRYAGDLPETALAVVAQAEVEGQVGPIAPLVLREERKEVVRQLELRIQDGHDVLRRIGRQVRRVERRVGREGEVAVPVAREEAFGADQADVGAELEVVRAARVAEVVDDLHAVLVAPLRHVLRLAEVAGRPVDLRHRRPRCSRWCR